MCWRGEGEDSFTLLLYFLIRLEHLDARKEVLLRGSKADLKRMWRATMSSWRLGRKAALKPEQGAEDGWDMVANILSIDHLIN